VLNSSIRKKALSGWLKKYHEKEFLLPLKLQKFLFFYEALSKIENDVSEFKKLKGYINGPVFSDVYGDYTYERDDFYKEVKKVYNENAKSINTDRAKLAGFLVSILNDNELSKFTHEFNIWKAKEKDITPLMKNVSLNKKDFNKKDAELLGSMKNMYPTDYIDSVEVYEISGKSFILNKKDISKLNNESKYIFISLANESSLQNPVYISISDDGVVLVD
jgi:hypothetical protein